MSRRRSSRRPIFLLMLCALLFLLFRGTDWGRKQVRMNNPTDSSYNYNRGFNDTMKMDFVRKMMKHAWGGYMKYAKGGDELNAGNGSVYNWNAGQSQLHTPVDALDTLWIMGLMEEFQEAKEIVLERLHPATWNRTDISVFETTIRALGGLLSAYELEGDEAFLQRAVELADLLMNAFISPNGIPLNFLNVKAKRPKGRKGEITAFLAEYGTLQLELQYLSDVTGNRTYQDKALRLFDFLRQTKTKFPGLYPTELILRDLTFRNDVVGIGAMSDSLYEYLLKLWLSTGEERYRKMFEVSANSVVEHLLTYSSSWKIWYLPDRTNVSKGDTFHHLTCFAGGWLALGALSRRTHKSGSYLDAAHKITHGCYKMYGDLTRSVGFEQVSMSISREWSHYVNRPEYLLRPELVESLVYMWRFTHDPIYRRWGWNIAQSIEAHCKTRYGYRGVPASLHPIQESFFLAETLKYLYMLFSEDDLLPFEEYVFNTEAHPFSIRGFGKRSNPEKWLPIEPNYYEKKPFSPSTKRREQVRTKSPKYTV